MPAAPSPGMSAMLRSNAPAGAFQLDRHARRGLAPGPRPSAEEIEQLPGWCEAVIKRGSGVVDELPAFPGTASKLLTLLDSVDLEPKALIDLIQTDPAISAQVLRLANSAAFVRGVEITTVHMATTRLGIKTVASVALAASTKALLDEQERSVRECFRGRWRLLSDMSLRVAGASGFLSKTIHRSNPEEAFLAGLMLDLGKAVALRVAGGMMNEGQLPSTLSAAALESLLHSTHVEFGVDLTAAWDLPGYISHVCANHHAPTPASAPVNDTLHVVRVASTLDCLRTNKYASNDLPAELAWSAQALGIESEPLAAIADLLADPSMQCR